MRNKRNFGDIVNGFIQFANRMDYIHSEFNSLKENGNANLGTQEFVFLMRNSLDALHQIYEIALPNDQTTLNTVQGLTTNLLDAYAAVLEKDYDAIFLVGGQGPMYTFRGNTDLEKLFVSFFDNACTTKYMFYTYRK